MPQFNQGDRVSYHPIGGASSSSSSLPSPPSPPRVHPTHDPHHHPPQNPALLHPPLTTALPATGRKGTSTSTGVIERVLTEPTLAGTTQVTVQASAEDPRYEVRRPCYADARTRPQRRPSSCPGSLDEQLFKSPLEPGAVRWSVAEEGSHPPHHPTPPHHS
ncbi:hypothetical protein FN846DRAFT_895684 [Sphaerosporella brunnea]|uniref:Hypervirulence associated protein TUDOR domain-containing protein n=1 Tax=Sphaerosporella brunnea TaxID=1250544 RepID=A0A5J5EEE2_9PEZI|nr:hypothetical protein FN846DRAFT_895684 [Sphaerosporella brunnea]